MSTRRTHVLWLAALAAGLSLLAGSAFAQVVPNTAILDGISDSYETRSVVYTTNIEFSGWGRVLGDKNMAAALIDRTVHHGRLVRFEGGSYRSEHALMTR